jgi:hypothetical protein
MIKILTAFTVACFLAQIAVCVWAIKNELKWR